MHQSSTIFIFIFLSLIASNAYPEGKPKLDCQIYGSTEKDQIMGYIDSGQDIVSALAISDSVISHDKSVTTFSITKIWRDRIGLPEQNIKVYTRYPDTIDYSLGEEYLLYIRYEMTSGNFITNICLGTKKIENVSKLEFDLLGRLAKQ